MRLDVLNSQAALQGAMQDAFQEEDNPRSGVFFLAVSFITDLYRFRHEGPTQARRTEALTLLRQQIQRVRHADLHRFTEDDDLARRGLMLAHKADLLIVLNQGQDPHLQLDGFAEENDFDANSLNTRLSFVRRQYLFEGLLKALDTIEGATNT